MTLARTGLILGSIVVTLTAAVSGWQNRAWPPPVQKVSNDSPTLTPDAELKTFHVPPGYRVELVASEPMVVDPIAVDYDLEGRLWVIEMLGFMPDTSGTDSREPLGRIAVLEDENDDGKMDKRTVFLDKLILPRAIKILDRGVLVAEPPNLWLARDTDGDLKADTKDLVRNDYGRLEGNPEHNANSLHWGLDNIIYTSEHTYHLQLKSGKFDVIPTLSRGQWGVGSDDGGRIYRNWNEQPLFVDIVPARYFMRNPNIVRTRGLYDIMMDPKDMTVWPVRPTRGVNRGYRDGVLRPDGTLTTYVSAGTPTIYRGDRLPKDIYGDAFITESAGNLVHRLKIVDDGTGRLSAKNAYPKGSFMSSTDERFRPVNLFAGPDGTLLVIDMYRGVIQDGTYWTDYLRNYIKTNNLELPVNLGRIWRVVHESAKRDVKPSLTKETPEGLVKRLSHPNGWYRDTAQRLLVERGATSVAPTLKQLALTSPDYRTRLHALWTLDGLGEIDAATVEKALADKSVDVRASAVTAVGALARRAGQPVVGDRREARRRSELDGSTAGGRLARDAAAGVARSTARVDAREVRRRPNHGRRGDERPGGTRERGARPAAPGNGDHAGVGRGGRHARPAHPADDAIATLSATIARGRDAASAEKLFVIAADTNRPMWQRVAVLRGTEMGLDGGGGGRGGGGGGGAGEVAAALPVRRA